MKTRKYFISYRCLQTNGVLGFGSIFLNFTGRKMQADDLEECNQRIKETNAERGIEMDADKIIIVFVKDVTNGF